MPDCSLTDRGIEAILYLLPMRKKIKKKITFSSLLGIGKADTSQLPYEKYISTLPPVEAAARCQVTETTRYQRCTAFAAADELPAISVPRRNRASRIAPHSFYLIFKFLSSTTCFRQQKQGRQVCNLQADGVTRTETNCPPAVETAVDSGTVSSQR